MSSRVFKFLVLFVLSVLFVPLMPHAVSDNTRQIDVLYTFYGWPEDINNDGWVDYLDASHFVSHYGESGLPGNPPFERDDINHDGSVDYLDASRLVTKYDLTWLGPVFNP